MKEKSNSTEKHKKIENVEQKKSFKWNIKNEYKNKEDKNDDKINQFTKVDKRDKDKKDEKKEDELTLWPRQVRESLYLYLHI